MTKQKSLKKYNDALANCKTALEKVRAVTRELEVSPVRKFNGAALKQTQT